MMTDRELMAMFDRSTEDSRWLGLANSQEYLALLSYFIQRTQKEAA